jgi:hypothetical protein
MFELLEDHDDDLCMECQWTTSAELRARVREAIERLGGP